MIKYLPYLLSIRGPCDENNEILFIVYMDPIGPKISEKNIFVISPYGPSRSKHSIQQIQGSARTYFMCFLPIFVF